jgi:hypothetical protein
VAMMRKGNEDASQTTRPDSLFFEVCFVSLISFAITHYLTYKGVVDKNILKFFNIFYGVLHLILE